MPTMDSRMYERRRRYSTPSGRAPVSQTDDHVRADSFVGGGRSLTINLRPDNEWVVVALIGEIDVATAPQLRSTNRGLLCVSLKRIVVDLDGVTFLGATGIDPLITMTSDVAHAGETLEVTHHPRLMELLKLSGETRRVNVTSDAIHAASGER